MRRIAIILTALMVGVIATFLLLEIALRVIGFKPGVYSNEYYPPKEIRYSPHYISDSLGISSRHRDAFPVNKQGFWSPYNYDQRTMDSLRDHTQEKIVMVVGDSYAEGLNAEPLDSSYMNLLAQWRDEHILNFGIAATDLQQYALVVKRYLEIIEPDLIVVNFYFGNDFQDRLRTITPYVPICYAFEDWACFYSIPTPMLVNYYHVDQLNSKEEALEFYLSHFTLWSKHANLYEKIIRHSVLLSKNYLNQRIRLVDEAYEVLPVAEQKKELTMSLVADIAATCEVHETELIFVGIPSPNDVVLQKNLEEHYFEFFEGVQLHVPKTERFTPEDYDGLEDNNHFELSGQRKYAQFLDSLLTDVLSSD